jgi:molybdenum cofactor synthesis domain-containing protein
MRLEIKSVNISREKGTVKTPQKFIRLDENGVAGDAHSGKWHRQVSLLAIESIHKFAKQAGRIIKFGEFAENITTEGKELQHLNVFDRLENESIVLEVTQIGKKCHGTNCEIFKEVGNCVMPKEGLFARVLKGGKLQEGDHLNYSPKRFRCKIITSSDRAYAGVYKDKSGPLLGKLVLDFFQDKGYEADVKHMILPDDREMLEQNLLEGIRSEEDVIFTTGGTGIGPRDVATEAVRRILEKELPGIMEMIRLKYGQEHPNALLSRSIAGVTGKTLVYALPGNPKAVKEYADEIFKTFMHAHKMLHNINSH